MLGRALGRRPAALTAAMVVVGGVIGAWSSRYCERSGYGVQADAATWAWMSWHSSNHRRLDHLTTGEEMIVTDRIPALNA